MGDDNTERQQYELEALESIFDESFRRDSEGDTPGGQLTISLHLPQDGVDALCCRVNKHGGWSDETIRVQYLPPLILNFQLPPCYPSSAPPAFTLSCKWLNTRQLTQLCVKLDRLYGETEAEVLYLWADFLAESGLDFLNLEFPLRLTGGGRAAADGSAAEETKTTDKAADGLDPRAIQDLASIDLLLPLLQEYDHCMRQANFNKSSFSCKVCLEERPGSACVQLGPCLHVFCRECLTGYYENLITDGSVHGLRCPDDRCTSHPTPAQVKSLVSEELFARYDRLLLQSSLDTMSDLVYCPRQSCRCPVLLDKDSWLGRCQACQFSFCSLCKMTYHGVAPCNLKADELKKLRDEYESADAATKTKLEKRYGAKRIRQAMEEVSSLDWLTDNSKQCPRCNTHIQKTDGCNKMSCRKCDCHFCWLCGEKLPRGNPYAHFSDKSKDCYNNLFLGMDENASDGEEEEEENFFRELEPRGAGGQERWRINDDGELDVLFLLQAAL